MTQREKVLAAAIGLLLVGWVAFRAIGSYRDGYDRRVAELQQLEVDLADEQFEAHKARAALRRLERFKGQSLPSDPDIARSEYAEWLKETIQSAGMELDSVKFGGSRRYEDTAVALTFGAAGTGSPDAVVRLLDAYYRLDALHQLTNLQLRPASDDGGSWRVSLTSVALVVDGTLREEGLPPVLETAPRLSRPDAEVYVASILGRNVFANYVPPPPPRPKRQVVDRPKPEKKGPPPFDDSNHAQLTGVVETGERLEAWVRVRTTGETLRLQAGDDLEVGQLRGRVQAVLPREIVVEADGVTWRTPLGGKLRDNLPDPIGEGG